MAGFIINMINEWTENLEFNLWSKVALGTAVCGVVVLYLIRKRRQKADLNEKSYPRDTVILHQIGRGPYAPSMSPYPVKLETYLRMAKIPYKNVHGFKMSPKGKIPWIEYNGKVIGDTQFCIEFLNQERKMDLNSNLSEEDRAIARSFQKMIEENTYWVLALYRWNMDSHKLAEIMGLPVWQIWLIRRNINSMAHSQGTGRHTEEERYQILVDDLKALSTFLGKKKFLFGDAPCETDCCIFGIIGQIYYHSFDTIIGDVIKDFPNLGEYCDRMKNLFWPDWDDCITHGGTREATN